MLPCAQTVQTPTRRMERLEMPGASAAFDASGATASLANVPADQALGLRLICLARAAAAAHMSEACASVRTNCAPHALRMLGQSQAASLLALKGREP